MKGLGFNCILVVCLVLTVLSLRKQTNKQIVGTHHNKMFHKSTVSAEVKQSETLLGRGKTLALYINGLTGRQLCRD